MGIVLSSPLKANDLKCEESYKIFEAKDIEEMKIYEKGDLNSALNFTKSSYYATNSKGPNPKKANYFDGEWMNDRVFKRHINAYMRAFEIGKTHAVNVSYGKPKINYISEIGEICVIPTVANAIFFGRNLQTVRDTIFIRDLQQNSWKRYLYLGVERKADMEVLFPDLLSKVKLSQALSNNKDIVDFNIEIFLEILNSRNTDIPKEELFDALKKQLEPQNEMLKINGYK